jgi:hypothetical protein
MLLKNIFSPKNTVEKWRFLLERKSFTRSREKL